VREANPRAIAFYEGLGARTLPGVRVMHLTLDGRATPDASQRPAPAGARSSGGA
jgi:hypothetical protein